jgi:hypothetical protein
MIVYFMASRQDIDKRIGSLRRFADIIHNAGHTLAWDWIEPVYAAHVNKTEQNLDWSTMYKDSMESITRADVVIAEVSLQSFSIGHQVASAIQAKKPTLLLCSELEQEYKYITGIPEVNATLKSYNEKNLESILNAFFEENDIQTKDMRFNFFIDRPIYNYLRWTSLKTGKTKAEILRELVEREIDHSNN